MSVRRHHMALITQAYALGHLGRSGRTSRPARIGSTSSVRPRRSRPRTARAWLVTTRGEHRGLERDGALGWRGQGRLRQREPGDRGHNLAEPPGRSRALATYQASSWRPRRAVRASAAALSSPRRVPATRRGLPAHARTLLGAPAAAAARIGFRSSAESGRHAQGLAPEQGSADDREHHRHLDDGEGLAQHGVKNAHATRRNERSDTGTGNGRPPGGAAARRRRGTWRHRPTSLTKQARAVAPGAGWSDSAGLRRPDQGVLRS
jgi:hypothetical protein